MKSVFLFPGQGAQRLGMMRDICDMSPVAASIFAQANEILGRDISSITFDGPVEVLGETHNTQPCLLTAEVAALCVLEKNGVIPTAIAGFSLGEWTALVAAKVLPFETALRLVQKRADYMQNAVPAGRGAMAAILGKDAKSVLGLCERVEGYVAPSNYNCPGQISVAGEARAVNELLSICETEGILYKKLAVSIPSHCALMQPAADKLAQALEKVTFVEPACPVVMNTTGEATTDQAQIKTNIISQLTLPVRFEASLEYMLDHNVDTFVEIGPGKTISGFVKKVAKKRRADVTILRIEDVETLRETFVALGI